MTDQKKKDKEREQERQEKPRRNEDFFGGSDRAYVSRKIRKQGFIRGKRLG